MAERTTTEADTARAVGCSPKSLSRYRAGYGGRPRVPHRFVGKRPFYDVGEVRAWMAEHGLEGDLGPTAPPAPAPGAPPAAPAGEGAATFEAARARSKGALVDAATKGLRHQKLQLDLEAEKGLERLGLDVKIRAARTPDELARLTQEVAALMATGKLSSGRGRAIREVLTEARQSLVAKRKEERAGPKDFDRALCCTEESVALVRNFEGITSDERRAQVLRFVEELAAVDARDGPRADAAEEA